MGSGKVLCTGTLTIITPYFYEMINNNLDGFSKICLFYRQADWHILLREAVKPLLQLELMKGIVFSIYFSRFQGDRVVLLLNKPEQSSEIQLLIRLFRSYIINKPSFTEPIQYPLDGFFMDYPNNSVFTDINDNRKSEKESDETRLLRMRLAESILKFFKIEDISDIDTIAICMHLGAISGIYTNLPDAVKMAETISLSNNRNTAYDNFEHGKVIDSAFEENADEIFCLIHNIWTVNFEKTELEWLTSWVCECRQYFSNSDKSLIYVTRMVYESLGFEDSRLTECYIKNVMKMLSRFKTDSLNL